MEQVKKEQPQIPEYLVDPDTGEMIPLEETEQIIETEQLDMVARHVRFLMAEIENIRKRRDKELERISNRCSENIEKIQRTVDWRLRQVQSVIGERTHNSPGYGKFKTQKGRAYIGDSCYQDMTPEKQLELQNMHQGCFRKKTTVTPDKKAIMALLKDIINGLSDCELPGFTIESNPDKFEFKPE